MELKKIIESYGYDVELESYIQQQVANLQAREIVPEECEKFIHLGFLILDSVQKGNGDLVKFSKSFNDSETLWKHAMKFGANPELVEWYASMTFYWLFNAICDVSEKNVDDAVRMFKLPLENVNTIKTKVLYERQLVYHMEDAPEPHIYPLLRNALKKCGMDYESIAEETIYSAEQVRQFFAAEKDPSIKMLRSISEVIGLNPIHMLGVASGMEKSSIVDYAMKIDTN